MQELIIIMSVSDRTIGEAGVDNVEDMIIYVNL